MTCVLVAVFLAVLCQVNSQVVHDTRAPCDPPRMGSPRTEQVEITKTVTEMETFHVPVTSSVWVSSVTVTRLVTEYVYIPASHGTATSLRTVTASPVSVVRDSCCIDSVRTVVSVISSFVPKADTKNVYPSVCVQHETKAVPAPSVQTVVQRVITTTTTTTTTTLRLTTITVTSTTHGCH
ncbi:uncharacterized protein LOC135106156 [Scylla paramamosain]|uniref:uncharacterized protein LOC135106156 n=1 Tax=Scylla paramamosain TaxID=85552 RepID=UPI0030829AA5